MPKYVFPLRAVILRLAILLLLGAAVFLFLKWERVRPWLASFSRSIVRVENRGEENRTELPPKINFQSRELPGELQEIRDSAGLFSLRIPKDWTIRAEEGPSEAQILRLAVASPSLNILQEGKYWRLTDGAELVLRVTEGEDEAAKAEDGGHGEDFRWKRTMMNDGQTYEYHVVRDPWMREGRLIDLHFVHGGRTFYFRYVYNAEKDGQGEETFKRIIGSFRFI